MEQAWEFFAKYTDQFTAIATIFGVLPTLIAFAWNQIILAHETRLARYDSISRSYLEYQQLCLQDPLLQTSWHVLPENDQQTLSAADLI